MAEFLGYTLDALAVVFSWQGALALVISVFMGLIFGMLPGLTATIAITTQESLATLLVPAKAFRFTPDNAPAPEAQHGHKTLWVQDAQGVRAVSVTPGLTDGIHTEIRNGITEGARVIVSKRIGKAPVGGDMPAGGSSPFMPQPPGQKKK